MTDDDTLKSFSSQYPKAKFAIRTLSNSHVQVTHPRDFIQHMGEILAGKLYKSVWVYTGFVHEADPAGWMLVKTYLEQSPKFTDWEPTGAVSLGESFRNVLCTFRQGTQDFLFIPNGDLVFSDPLNVINLVQYSDHLKRDSKYVGPVISYGYGALPQTAALANVMSDIDEREGQAHFGVRDAQIEMEHFQRVGLKGDFERFSQYFHGMSAHQVGRACRELVVKFKKINALEWDPQHLIEFRQKAGLPAIDWKLRPVSD